MHAHRVVVRAFLIFIAVSWAAAFRAPAASPLRVLPLGDSITYGSSVLGGYRFPLHTLLTNAGYVADFVGTQTGNATNGQTEVEHEGHGGWKINQIDAIILGVFDVIEDPDVILVLIGTNDYGGGYDTPNATNRLDALIEKMAVNRPHAKIVVANLLERGEPYNTQIQTSFNPAVPNIVAKHAALGREVYFTDLRSSLPVTDMPDALHPGALGYAKMSTNWFAAITNLFGPEGSTNPPAVSRASGLHGFTNVTVRFSKPVGDDATNLTHYAIGGGLSLLGATLDPARRVVTLTTTPQEPLTVYPLTVSGVQDRTDAQMAMSADASLNFLSSGTGERGAWRNVAEASEYTLLYSLDIPNLPNYSGGVTYDIDLRAYTTNPVRVAYYLELQTPGNAPEFLWVSMDPPTNAVGRLGVPTVASGALFQQAVSNLNVISSVATVAAGSNLTGWLEFWPRNYSASNAMAVLNASNSAYDWGDIVSGSGTYGSMQVHVPESNQVLFAFNRWGGTGGVADLGIGNRPGSADVDWTFATNASSYSVKTLQVWVLPADNTNAPVLRRAAGLPGLTNVLLEFSEPLDDDATNLAHYGITDGSVLTAELDPLNKLTVRLTTTPQPRSTFVTVGVTGLTDRTTLLVPMSPTTAMFMSNNGPGPRPNVPEAADYALAYSVRLPTSASFNSTGVAYQVDCHYGLPDFDRIAYYLELFKSGGVTDWVWVSMDAFTTDAGKIGIPASGTGAFFQQPVSNMNVICTLPAVTGVTNATGSLEFWSTSYAVSNVAGVAGASDLVYDWGDLPTPGNYGSMQVHHPATGQVIFAVNNWGSNGTLDLGIGNNAGNTNLDWTFMANAGSYVTKNLQVYVRPRSDTTPPSVVSVLASPDRQRITVTFSEPLADGAADLANFALNGAALLGATLSADLRSVVLTTGFQPPGGGLTLSVQNIRDRSAAANLIVPVVGAPVGLPVPPAVVTSRVPEAAGYELVAHLNLAATAPGWNENGTVYTVDQRATTSPFDRIAYYLELVPTNSPGTTNWVFTAMDPFSTDVNLVGVPDRVCGASFQQLVTNLDVRSNVPGVTNGTGLVGGNIEFWPFNYTAATNALVAGSHTAYDWSDTISKGVFGSGGHGSMQVHYAPGTNVLFAYNNWGSAGGTLGIGIGVQPTNHPDWTQSSSANIYSSRNLYILARPAADAQPPAIVSVRSSAGRTNVLIRFDEPLEPVSATDAANYALDGGLAVTRAALRSNLREVLLTTDPQTPGTAYTLTVGGVKDRSAVSNAVPPGTTVAFTALPVVPFGGLVGESTNYVTVLKIPLPGTNPNWNVTAPVYAWDMRGFVTGAFDRVAYFLETATNAAAGPTNWVWTSGNAFTRQLQRVGIPSIDTGAGFLQRFTNMNVYSSVAGLVSGANVAGSLEFWPFNYSVGTNSTIPGSNTLYDVSDSYTTTAIGYGSMQVHAYATGQVLLAVNRWGSSGGVLEVGTGPQPTGHPDWTSSANGTNLEVRNLYVLVRTAYATSAPPVILPAAVARHPAGRLYQAGETARLSVLAGGSGPVAYQWRFDGAPLAGQTNAWLELPGLQIGDTGRYDAVVSNAGGVETSQVARLEVNRPPNPASERFMGAVQDRALIVAQAGLLSGSYDPDGDAVAFAGVGAASTNGGAVGAAAGEVTYSPAGGFTGADRWTYFIDDGRGGGATGAVRVMVVGSATYNLMGAVGRSGGVWRVNYSGLPAGTYALQRSTNMVDWTSITNLPAGEDGSIRIDDPEAPAARSLFYRALAP